MGKDQVFNVAKIWILLNHPYQCYMFSSWFKSLSMLSMLLSSFVSLNHSLEHVQSLKTRGEHPSDTMPVIHEARVLRLKGGTVLVFMTCINGVHTFISYVDVIDHIRIWILIVQFTESEFWDGDVESSQRPKKLRRTTGFTIELWSLTFPAPPVAVNLWQTAGKVVKQTWPVQSPPGGRGSWPICSHQYIYSSSTWHHDRGTEFTGGCFPAWI